MMNVPVGNDFRQFDSDYGCQPSSLFFHLLPTRNLSMLCPCLSFYAPVRFGRAEMLLGAPLWRLKKLFLCLAKCWNPRASTDYFGGREWSIAHSFRSFFRVHRSAALLFHSQRSSICGFTPKGSTRLMVVVERPTQSHPTFFSPFFFLLFLKHPPSMNTMHHYINTRNQPPVSVAHGEWDY